MRQLLAKHKQFIAGLAVGATAVMGFFLLDSSGSEPFQNVPYVIRDVSGDTVFKTPNFTIVYRGVSGVNAGGSMTIAGRNRGAAELWSGGYVSNWGGSDKGIENIALYDSHQGIASVFVAGQFFQITDNASRLRVADSVVPLGSSPFIIVEKNQRARIAKGSEAKTALASVGAGNLDYDSVAPPKP